MSDQKDPKGPEPKAEEPKRAAKASGSYVVVSDGVSIPGGVAWKHEVREAAAFGDAERVGTLVKAGSIREASAEEAALRPEEGEEIARISGLPPEGTTVEQIDAQINALEEQKRALVKAEKAKK